jgi:hypothetical protein
MGPVPAGAHPVIRFLDPWFLLLLLALPALALWPRRSERGRDGLHFLLRACVFAFAILALAKPVMVGETRRVHQVVILDRTASARSTAAGEAWAAEFVARAPRSVRATLIELGPEEQASCLSAALEQALRAIPDGARGAVTLLSDGLATDRRWGPAAQSLSERHIPVHTIGFESAGGLYPVRLAELAPLRVGHTARVAAEVVGRCASMSLVLSGPEGELDRIEAQPCDGRGRFTFEFEPAEPGFLPLSVVVSGEGSRDESARIDSTIAVQDPLRVLYLGDRMLGGAERVSQLVGRGFRVDDGSVNAIEAHGLDGYDLTLLDDRPASALPEAFQRELSRAVTEGGLGLLAAGGSAAFGPGGYYETPLAEVLPVEFVQKEEKRDPSTTLVVIIDTSGSMGGNRVQLAKEVARLSIRRLLPHDKVGIVEFYGAKRWAAPIQPASNAIELERALNRLNAGGGTVILPAIEEAFYGLKNVETRYKHVLVLTDGGVETGAFEPLMRRMADEGINVSTVLIGPDAHSEFLVSLANWGKGRFYSVPNRFNLPEILLKQPASAKLPAYRPGVHTLNGRGGPGWWGDVDPSSVPALSGYVETTPRPGAEKLLETVEGSHPVLASWQYGLGRVTAFLSEPTGPGTESWKDWDGYGPLLARVLGRTSALAREPFAFEVERRDHELTVTARRRVRENVAPRAVLLAEDGNEELELAFRERADGLFDARFVLAPEREARLLAGALGEEPRTRLVSPARGDVAPELNVDPLAALDLEQLAKATGGRHASAARIEDFEPSVGGAAFPVGLRDLAPWCLLIALLSYLTDLAWRRRSFARSL